MQRSEWLMAVDCGSCGRVREDYTREVFCRFGFGFGGTWGAFVYYGCPYETVLCSGLQSAVRPCTSTFTLWGIRDIFSGSRHVL